MEMKETVYKNSCYEHIDSEVVETEEETMKKNLEDFGDGTALAVINISDTNPCAHNQFPRIDSIYDYWNDFIPGSIPVGKKWTTQEIVEEAKKTVLRYFQKNKLYEERMDEDEELTCPCCGAPIEEDWNFCNKCGTKLS